MHDTPELDKFDRIAIALFVWLALVPSMLWNGYVLSWLWAWFVVPLGVPALGVAHAIGLAMAVRFVTQERKRILDKPVKEVVTDAITFSFIYPVIVLGIGYIVHLVMV